MVGILCMPAAAQQPTTLTLQQAEQIALQNHPRLFAASLSAQAAAQAVKEAQSAYFPTAAASVTAVDANNGTAVAAGAVTTSSLSSRFATGITLLQLVTDFGRARSLTRTAQDRAAADAETVADVRAHLLLSVREAYFAVLGADAVQRAAQAALDTRRLLYRQVSALARDALKSTLDVSFSDVLVSEAELAVYQAQNDTQESRAQLAAAMGIEQARNVMLADEPLPPELSGDLEALIAEAKRDRPEMIVLGHNRDAAYQFAQAEKKLSYPTVNLAATAGIIPERNPVLPRDNYEAAGVNVNIPVFNGGLFAARRAEARLRAEAADKNLADLSLQVSRSVQSAWFEANNAFHKMDVDARLVKQAELATHLAQARYDAGLGSIVELNQAQLSQTAAEIEAAGAKYEYLSRRADLDFAIGAIR